MGHTFKWCQDKTKLDIFNKQVFFVTRFGNKHWYLNGKFHRENGPAVEVANAYKGWYLNGKFHREDGPALEDANGNKWWYLNGKLHRENGPAIEYANGDKWWYLNGESYSESDYWKEVKK